MADKQKKRTIRVTRTTAGARAAFDVSVEEGTTVLDALEEIRTQHDSSLLYRHSCHHGSCGTCGMMINGKPRLACITSVDEVDGDIDVKPLHSMKTVGDVAVDPASLFGNLPGDATYIRASEVNRDVPKPEAVASWQRFEDCIECGLCVAACPVALPFLGPAALAGFNRESENRPDRSAEMITRADTEDGAWRCERHLECSAVCPTGVYPAKHIAVLQRKIKKARLPDDAS